MKDNFNDDVGISESEVNTILGLTSVYEGSKYIPSSSPTHPGHDYFAFDLCDFGLPLVMPHNCKNATLPGSLPRENELNTNFDLE